MSRWRSWVLLAVTLAAMLLTARLGLWQLDRAGQKLALQAAIAAREHEPLLDGLAALASSVEQVDGQEHRRARATGRWQTENTVYLDNRQMDGRPGFYVLTPLMLDDGTALLVQRGWRPRDFEDRARLPPVHTPSGQVAVEGRLARSVARLYEFDGTQAGPIRQNLALPAFAAETGLRLRPVLLLQTSPADDGLRRDWPVPTVDVHKHYGYAFQWFALSALVIVLHVWFRIIRPRRAARQ